MEVADYLDALGLAPQELPEAERDRIAHLQRAHVRSLPFANLAIVGDPHGPYTGEPADLSVGDDFRRLVDRGLGGLCYDHNALFSWALAQLGIPHHLAGAVVCTDRPNARTRPDTHMTVIAEIGGGIITDVGFGDVMRAPIPLDGEPVPTTDGDWRAIAHSREDAAYTVQVRRPGSERWEDRFRFVERSRRLSYFADGFAYHYRDPSAPFTGDPVVSIATASGTRTLSRRRLTITENGEQRKIPVTPERWHTVLREQFGIDLPPEAGGGRNEFVKPADQEDGP